MDSENTPAHKHKQSFCGTWDGLLSACSVRTQHCEVHNGWSTNKAFIEGIGHGLASCPELGSPKGERRVASASNYQLQGKNKK